MKKIFIVLIVGVLLYAGLHQPKSTIIPIEPRHNSVILYATSWCGYCKKARAFFEEHHIKYTEYDIENSNIGRLQYDQFKVRGVPVIDVRGLIVRGYDEDELLESLKVMDVL